MANYLLVENRQIIHLGPIAWRHRFIQSELDDLEVNFTVSPAETGYIRINDNFEIFPVGEALGVFADEKWEDTVGPIWEFTDTTAIPTYGKQDKPVEQVKEFIKNIVSSQRYDKEQSGTQVELRPGVTVSIDTSRDGRAIFVQVFATMADDASVDWKFPEGWFNITKAELGNIINGGFNYIQSQFNWEKEYVERIQNTSSIDELKTIYDELNPVVTPGVI